MKQKTQSRWQNPGEGQVPAYRGYHGFKVLPAVELMEHTHNSPEYHVQYTTYVYTGALKYIDKLFHVGS